MTVDQVLPTTTRAWHLVQRPQGTPSPDDFAIREVALPALEDGQILVENVLLSVDPYMRGRMNDVESYMPPYELGAPLDGPAIGRVIASRVADVPEQSYVFHSLGWREHAVLAAGDAQVVDATAAPLDAYLGPLGITGLTAYVGMQRVAQVQDGDVVYVSGAAGAVGTIAGQIAKIMGAQRVIGSTGSDTKAAALTGEFGYDAGFNYRDGGVLKNLTELAPEGLDVVFDNVGGEALDAGIARLRTHARVVLSGMVSEHTGESAGVRNIWNVSATRSRVQGFMAMEETDLFPQFYADMPRWIASGEITYRTTVTHGFGRMYDAFVGMLRGENTGKAIVEL